ncbi:MAG: Ig-like domain-containing protein, partial [Bacteroidetes bacterium]|nr:Ig-like domain-containing protein [Bacteroidota bacterium]MCL2302835.1 Ig-like domain-containing protein [Lentimicrobiaceae bacterium]
MRKFTLFLFAMLFIIGAAFAQTTPTGDCNPPTNLSVEYDITTCKSAHLKWEAPTSKGKSATPIIAKIVDGITTGRTEKQTTGSSVSANRLPIPDGFVTEPDRSIVGNITGVYADAYAGDAQYGTYHTLNLANGNRTKIGDYMADPFPTGEDYDGTNIYRLYNNGLVQMVHVDGHTIHYGTIPGSAYTVGLAYNWVADNGIWYYYQVSGSTAPYNITLFSLNMATLTRTQIGSVSSGSFLRGLAMDNTGALFAIAIDAESLVKINPVNAQITTVGPLGIMPRYGQDIAFDRQTNTLYAAPHNYLGAACWFGTINTTTGAFTQIANYGFTQITTLCITKPATTTVAAAPTNFLATTVGTTLACNLSWTNPTHTVAGNPLTHITKMVIKRNGVTIAEFFDAPVGGTMSFQDNSVPSMDEYIYSVFAVTAEGNGVSANTIAELGIICTIKLVMEGPFDDSWTGSSIGITVNGVSYGTHSADGYYSLEKVLLLPVGEVKFTYTTTPGAYTNNEGSFRIYDYNNVLIFDAPRWTLSGLVGNFFTYQHNCAGIVRYNIYRDDNLLVSNFVGNTYTDESFNDSQHTWSVTVACNEGGESEPVSYTPLACGELIPGDCNPISNLAVTYDATTCMTAHLSWDLPDSKGAAPKSDLCQVAIEFYGLNADSWRASTMSHGVHVYVDGIYQGTYTPGFVMPPAPGGVYMTRFELMLPEGDVEVRYNRVNNMGWVNEMWIKIYDWEDNYMGGCLAPGAGCVPGWTEGHLITSFSNNCGGTFNYHVYRNDVFLGKTKLPYFDDNTYNSSVGHTWSVIVVCNDGTGSEPVSATLPACGNTCDANPVTNLQVEFVDDCSYAQLTWDEPVSKKASTPVIAKITENDITERSNVEQNGNQHGALVPSFNRNQANEQVHPFTIPSIDGRGPNTVAYGINTSLEPNSRPVTIPLNNPASGGNIGSNVIPGLPSGGDWVNGEWIAFNTGDNYIYRINPANGSYTVAPHYVPEQVLGMAYHVTEEIAYVYAGGGSNNFWKVDLNTGAAQYAFTCNTGGMGMWCFTITNEGRFIGMASEFLPKRTFIIEINPTTGAIDVLAEAPIFSWFIQDMSMDRETNTLYWAATATDATTYADGRLYRFDLATHQLTYLGPLPNNANIGGFAIPAATADLAKAPTNVTLTPNGNTLTGTLSWKNPTQTIGGTLLTSITNMTVTYNGSPVEVITPAAPGQDMDMIVNVPHPGIHQFSVHAVTPEGNGFGTTASAEFGDICNIKFVLRGVHEEVWAGASIRITVNGIDFGAVDGFGSTNVTKIVSIPVGNVVLTYIPGMLSDANCSFDVYNFADELLFSAPQGSLSELVGQFFSYYNDCGIGFQYNVYRDDILITTVKDGTSYKDVSYNRDKTHTWSVKVLCKAGGESEPVDITKSACLFGYTLTPTDGATGVALDAEISVTFKKNIIENDLTGITINGNAVTGATITENKLTIPHDDFTYETQYTVHVPANAITYFEEAITWSFTTENKPVYTIVASVIGGNGSINPSGNVPVTWGNDQKFTFTPDTGYEISQVLVNGVNNTAAVAAGEYTFVNVTANHTISVSFIIKTYTITVTQGTNGTVTPGTATVNHGATPMYTITPDPGYHITAILVDGTPITYTVNPGATVSYDYTFAPVENNRTITATFALNCYVPIINAEHVAVTPTTCIPHGSDVTFTFTPDFCYHNMVVRINGIVRTLNANNQFTLTNVTARPNVVVDTDIKIFSITATPLTGINPWGAITPAGVVNVNCGSDFTFHFHTEPGYRVKTL